MPLTTGAPAGPRRRSLLASVAGAALLTGCSDAEDPASDGARGARSASATQRIKARAARDSGDLLDRYEAALAAHPALAARLGPLRDEVARHAKSFGAPARPAAPASPSPSPSASPASEKDTVSALAKAEREIADRRAAALVEAPAELARLLASVAAAGAGHAYLLTKD
ncbi:hypothetical protein ACWCOW_15435 [Streptomyces sp. NPDC001939]|uniref:hypothetical protein n=1 Tax=unclassified Streptomyces TaxID=2593676 RepID=UPI0022568C53|nr:hypothetical protein [Streptomyces sp. NBC_00401]MCX5086551.1 hypothetical protein [Streptomyces sp. NBC_00401]